MVPYTYDRYGRPSPYLSSTLRGRTHTRAGTMMAIERQVLPINFGAHQYRQNLHIRLRVNRTRRRTNEGYSSLMFARCLRELLIEMDCE